MAEGRFILTQQTTPWRCVEEGATGWYRVHNGGPGEIRVWRDGSQVNPGNQPVIIPGMSRDLLVNKGIEVALHQGTYAIGSYEKLL